MDLIRLNQLHAAGGAVLAKFERLTAAAEHSYPGSPEERARREFCRDYQAAPAAVVAAAEAEEAAAAVVAAGERVAAAEKLLVEARAESMKAEVRDV
jgi:hypothetical protein